VNLNDGMSDDYLWNPSAAPDAEVVKLEQALRQFRFEPRPLRALQRRRLAVGMAAAAALVLTIGGSAWLTWRLTSPEPWSVEAIAGAPMVTDERGNPILRLRTGARVETNARAVARVAVGSIGIADLEPDSRLDIVRDDRGQHRVLLRRGTLNARIWAAPRFFVVETRSAVAIDLGCVYTLHVDSSGNGILAVSYGEVELRTSNQTSLLAAGTAAQLSHEGGGAGIPYPTSSSAEFRNAVLLADAGALDSASFRLILREATQQGTITLWHLIPRVPPAWRIMVLARLREIAPIPEAVNAHDVMGLNAESLTMLKGSLRPLWSSEPTSWLRRFLVRAGFVKPVALLASRAEVQRAVDTTR
jgi:hypothetical protein